MPQCLLSTVEKEYDLNFRHANMKFMLRTFLDVSTLCGINLDWTILGETARPRNTKSVIEANTSASNSSTELKIPHTKIFVMYYEPRFLSRFCMMCFSSLHLLGSFLGIKENSSLMTSKAADVFFKSLWDASFVDQCHQNVPHK